MLDRDLVAVVAEKLHHRFPEQIPVVVHMGKGVRPGSLPARRIRAKFAFKGKALAEDEPIGEQCLRTSFVSYF